MRLAMVARDSSCGEVVGFFFALRKIEHPRSNASTSLRDDSVVGSMNSIAVTAMTQQNAHNQDDEFTSVEQFSTFDEERTLQIFESAAIPIGITDASGRYVFSNTAYTQLVGYSSEELRQTNFQCLVHPDDLETNMEVIRQVMEAGHLSCEIVNRYVKKNGKEVWVRKYISTIRDDQGRTTHLLGLVTDVTGRKVTEQKLRENQERLRAILDSSTDAIISIDQYGVIENVNPATLKMFGYRQEELIGHKINLLMPPPYSDEHDDYITRYLETGEKKIIGIGRELSARRKDGSLFPIDLTVNEVDHMHVFTGFIRDLSESKLKQEQLLEAERLSGLGEAMATLVHESRNGLARIEANLRRLARRTNNDGEIQQLIDAALKASDDVGRQFEEVREYAAPIVLKCTAVNLRTLVEEAWSQIVAERTDRKMTVRMTSPEPEFVCEADRFLLVNAFRNILDNTVNATDEVHVVVDVEFVKVELHAAPAISTTFRDYGSGLTTDVANHALEAFFTTKSRGTGLGLSIVKRIVDAHGGDIEIFPTAPASGSGTIVRVTLPRIQPGR